MVDNSAPKPASRQASATLKSRSTKHGSAWFEIAVALAVLVITFLLCFATATIVPRGANESLFDAIRGTAQILAFIFGVPAVVLGLYNHSRSVEQRRENTALQLKAELWKRREFVAGYIEKFEAFENVKFAMALLDYNVRELKLPGTDRWVKFTEADLLTALSPRLERGIYSEQHTIIRDAFDQFFSGLDRLGVMNEAGLVDYDDLTPYVLYWLELLDAAPRDRGEFFGPVIRRYIAVFHFDSLMGLMKKAGVPTFDRQTDQPLVKKYVAAIDQQSA